MQDGTEKIEMQSEKNMTKQSREHRLQPRQRDFVRKPKLLNFTIPILSPSALLSAIFDCTEVFEVAPLPRDFARSCKCIFQIWKERFEVRNSVELFK